MKIVLISTTELKNEDGTLTSFLNKYGILTIDNDVEVKSLHMDENESLCLEGSTSKILKSDLDIHMCVYQKNLGDKKLELVFPNFQEKMDELKNNSSNPFAPIGMIAFMDGLNSETHLPICFNAFLYEDANNLMPQIKDILFQLNNLFQSVEIEKDINEKNNKDYSQQDKKLHKIKKSILALEIFETDYMANLMK